LHFELYRLGHGFVFVGVAVIVSVITMEIHIIPWPVCTIGWYFGPILDARRQQDGVLLEDNQIRQFGIMGNKSVFNDI
jgi:hypothetical protein